MTLLVVAQTLVGCGDRDAAEGAPMATVTRLAPDVPDDPEAATAVAQGDGSASAVATAPSPSDPIATADPNDGLVLRFAGTSYAVEPDAADGVLSRLVASPTAPTAFTYASWHLATATGCLAAEHAGGGEVVLAPCDDGNVLRWEFADTFGWVFRPTGAASLPWFTAAERPCRATEGTCLALTPALQLTAVDVALDAAPTPPRPVRGIPIFVLAQPDVCLRDVAGTLDLAPCDPTDAGQSWSLPIFASHAGGPVVRSGLGNCLDASDPRAPTLSADCSLAAIQTTAAGLSNGSLYVVVGGLGRYLTLDGQNRPSFDGAGYPPTVGFGPPR